MVGFAAGKTHALGAVELQIETPFAVVFMTALGEGASVAEAGRLLVTTVARARNTGMRYSEDGTRLLNVGRAPIRLEPVRLALRLDGAAHEAIYYEIAYA